MNIIIHRLTDLHRYADIRNEVRQISITSMEELNKNCLALNNYHPVQIYQFTLQIMNHPLKLSGLGFFDFGSNFLRKVCFYILSMFYIFIFY